jgi:hypothetical protein
LAQENYLAAQPTGTLGRRHPGSFGQSLPPALHADRWSQPLASRRLTPARVPLSASRLTCGARASATLSVRRQLANHLRSTAASSAANWSAARPPGDRVDLPAAYKVSQSPIPASNSAVPACLGCEIESRSPYSYAVAEGSERSVAGQIHRAAHHCRVASSRSSAGSS